MILKQFRRSYDTRRNQGAQKNDQEGLRDQKSSESHSGDSGLSDEAADAGKPSPESRTSFSRAAEQEKPAPSNIGGHEPLADQSTATALNDSLVKYGLGEKWRNAYEAVKLPDALSGIREEIQAAFGRDIRPVAPTNSAFDQFNGIHVKGEIFVNVAGKVGFVPIAGHELWHNIMSCGLKGKGASNE